MSRAARWIAVSAAAAASALAFAPAANAGVLVSSATDCEDRSASQVFSPWLDPANYVLAPGGTAESADQWTFTGGATIAEGQEPWNVVDDHGTRSVSLPSGSTATTDAICVGIEHPTLRFFVRSSGTNLLSSLRADVLFEDAFGNVRSLPVGLVLPSASWTPTAQMVLVVNLLPLLPGEKTAVAFRFVPQGRGTWSVDDVHVDPWRTR
ncbi:hypothetical protein [Paraconexibacter sp.]|uniref:hypothetical protein n=1 Tax=Paraconexibacter sp. TaxID=2949640 RepID=UPI003569EFBE